MLGTIIANISANNRGSVYMPSDLPHTYHLVKPEPEDPTDGQRGQKIVSEVFLTRLLSTKVSTVGGLLSYAGGNHYPPYRESCRRMWMSCLRVYLLSLTVAHSPRLSSLCLISWINKLQSLVFKTQRSSTHGRPTGGRACVCG